MSASCCSPVGNQVQVPGPSGANAWAIVTNPFTVPATNANVTVSVNQTAGFVDGQNIYIASSSASGGNFLVYSVNSPTSITLTFVGFAGDFAVGSTVASGSLLVPGTGNVSALSTIGFTTTTAGFTINATSNTPLTISVVSAAPFLKGQNIFIGDGTNYCNGLITSLSVSGKTISFIPLQFPGDAGGSTTINSGAIVAPGHGNVGTFGMATTTTQTFTLGNSFSSVQTLFVDDMSFASVQTPQAFVIMSRGQWATLLNSSGAGVSTTQLSVYPASLGTDSPSGTMFPVGSIVYPVCWTPNTSYIPGFSGDPIGHQMAAYAQAASGSGYTLTATANSLVTVGATAATITLPLEGAYMLFATAVVNAAGATFAATQTVTVSLNNTTSGSTPITNASQHFQTPVITTKTQVVAVASLPVVFVNASAAAVDVSMVASVTVIPSAGTLEIMEFSLTAIKIV